MQMGFPRCHRGKVSTCQYRRGRLDPWVGKISWSQKWQPAAVFLPGKSHGQKSLRARVHTLTERLSADRQTQMRLFFHIMGPITL